MRKQSQPDKARPAGLSLPESIIDHLRQAAEYERTSSSAIARRILRIGLDTLHRQRIRREATLRKKEAAENIEKEGIA